MKIYKCECCGGVLRRINTFNEYICEYCGSRYEESKPDIPPIRIETYQNPVISLKAKYCVDDDLIKNIGESDVASIAINALKRNLADALVEHMTIETMPDPINMQQIITGKIRIVKNGFVF